MKREFKIWILTIAFAFFIGGCGSGGSGDDGDGSVTTQTGGTDQNIITSASSCKDGVKNGNETGIDCGGVCGATCAVGTLCSSANDCLFGECASGVCIVPTSGPAPTGSVLETILSETKTVSAVTPEHTLVSFSFPAGAVKKPLDFRLTPLPASGSSWLSMAIEPAGILLAAPVAIRVELPASVPDSEKVNAVLRFSKGSDATLLPTTVTGNILEASSMSLGLPAFVSGTSSVSVLTKTGTSGQVANNLLFLPSPSELLEAIPMPLSARLALADALLAAFRATNRYRDALELTSIIQTILQQRNNPADAGRIRAWAERYCQMLWMAYPHF